MVKPVMGWAGLVLIIESIVIWAVLSGGVAMAKHRKKHPTPTAKATPSVRLENPRDVQDHV
jgi:hypothetical protein